MRLFIAIQLDKKLKKQVRDVQNAFRQQGVRGNYPPEENLHVTLAFIGEYGDPDAVLEAMRAVSFAPFRVTMDRVGCFGDLWWTGLSESEAMEALVRKLRRSLAEAAIPYDRKRFKAHVTFLRKPEYGRGGIPHICFAPAVMEVSGISLMRSCRGRNGMIYTELGFVEAGST